MNLGRFDQRIAFYNQGDNSDNAGGYVPALSPIIDEDITSAIPYVSTWANIEQLKTPKNMVLQQLEIPEIYRVNIHYRNGLNIDGGMIVLWNNKLFRILNKPVVNDVRLRRFLSFDMQYIKDAEYEVIMPDIEFYLEYDTELVFDTIL